MILPDLRGHGGSSKPAAGYRLIDYTADSLAIIRQEGLDRFALAGHSLGALVAPLVAAEFPERVDAVLLEDPPLPFPRTEADLDDYWRHLGATTKAYLALKRQTHQVRIETLLTWEPGLWRAEAERFAGALAETADGVYEAVIAGASRGTVLPPDGLRLDVPALVFQAGDPGRRALRVRGITQLKLALPCVEVVSIPRTGHDVLRDAPEAYRELVVRHLAGWRRKSRRRPSSSSVPHVGSYAWGVPYSGPSATFAPARGQSRRDYLALAAGFSTRRHGASVAGRTPGAVGE